MNLAPELERLEHLLATLLAAEPANPHEWAEADAPWVTWTLPYTDRLTRVTGYATAELTCCICGAQEVHRARVPRWGPVPEPEGGRHRYRLEAIARHDHPDQRDPRDWALPLRNLAAGADVLDILRNVVDVARLEVGEAELERRRRRGH